MNSIAGFIPAAGEGRGLRPASLLRPKALMPFCGVPALELAAAQLADLGLEAIVVNASYLTGQVEEAVARLRERHGWNLILSPKIACSGSEEGSGAQPGWCRARPLPRAQRRRGARLPAGHAARGARTPRRGRDRAARAGARPLHGRRRWETGGSSISGSGAGRARSRSPASTSFAVTCWSTCARTVRHPSSTRWSRRRSRASVFGLSVERGVLVRSR